MRKFLLVTVSFILTLVFLQHNENSESRREYASPSQSDLKMTQGQIFFVPLSGRRGSTGTSLIVKSKGESISLTCSLYAHAKRCYQFSELGKTENYFDQLALKQATVWWLPIKHKSFKGLVYQIEKNGKVIIDFETFDLSYQQEELNNAR